jgi:hypothetical protein
LSNEELYIGKKIFLDMELFNQYSNTDESFAWNFHNNSTTANIWLIIRKSSNCKVFILGHSHMWSAITVQIKSPILWREVHKKQFSKLATVKWLIPVQQLVWPHEVISKTNDITTSSYAKTVWKLQFSQCWDSYLVIVLVVSKVMTINENTNNKSCHRRQRRWGWW